MSRAVLLADVADKVQVERHRALEILGHSDAITILFSADEALMLQGNPKVSHAVTPCLADVRCCFAWWIVAPGRGKALGGGLGADTRHA